MRTPPVSVLAVESVAVPPVEVSSLEPQQERQLVESRRTAEKRRVRNMSCSRVVRNGGQDDTTTFVRPPPRSRYERGVA
jgi:hypothetical protein